MTASLLRIFIGRSPVIAAFLISFLTGAASAQTVQIKPAYDLNKCVDVFQGSVAPSYGVDIFTCGPGDPHESFAFHPGTSGTFSILTQNGAPLCLDANGLPRAGAVQLVQNPCSGSLSQQWDVRDNGDSTFSVLTSDGRAALTVEGANNSVNRAAVLVVPVASKPASRFYIPGFGARDDRLYAQAVHEGNRSIGPNYFPDPVLTARNDVPKGALIKFTMDSSQSANFPGHSQITGPFSRQVLVYVPKQYVKGGPIPFMVSQDAAYRPQLVSILDNAIYDKTLPVMVIVFAGNGGGQNGIGIAHDQGTERNLEYDTMSNRYVKWVQEELLPRVEAETLSQLPEQAVTLSQNPEDRGTLGCSSGAAAALTMAWFAPNLFRKVISYSGSYTNLQYPPDPAYPHGAWAYPEGLIERAPAKPVRIWMEVGTQDMDWSKWGEFLDWQQANRTMAAAFESKGYHYHFDLALDARHCDSRVSDQTLYQAMKWVWADHPVR